jgi:uncharacterized protein (TIGR02001 family)
MGVRVTMAASLWATAILSSADAFAVAPAAPASTNAALEPAFGLNANAALLSDYRYDGVSESNRRPTWQAGLTYVGRNGLYVGTQLTGVDVQDKPRTRLEADVFAGALIPVAGSDLGLQVSYMSYPDQRAPGPRYAFVEPQVSLTHRFERLTLSGEADWSPAYFGGLGQAWDLRAGVAVAVRHWLTLSGHIGRLWLSRGPSLIDWDLGGTASWRRLYVDVRYGGTDLSDAQCGFTSWCAPGVSATVGVRIWP